MTKRQQAAIALRLQEREQRAGDKARKALAKFRPRKAERRSFVFISTTGQRLKSVSRRSGYLVYVKQNGKKEFVPDPKEKRKQPKAKSFSSYRVTGLRNRKTAQRKFFAELTATKTKRPRLLPTPGERLKRQGIDLIRIAKNIGADLERTARGMRGGKQFVLDVEVTVKEKGSGIKHVYTVQIEFKQRDLQKIGKAGYRNFVLKSVYSFLAEQLSRDGLVSGGSARYIRALPQNKGEKKADWVDRKGEAWEKTEFAVVEIVRVQWDIRKVTIRSG